MITSDRIKFLKKSSKKDVAKELTEGLSLEHPSWTDKVDIFLDEFGCPFFPYLMATHGFTLTENEVTIDFEDGKLTIPRFDAVVFWTSFRSGMAFDEYQAIAMGNVFEDIDYDFSKLGIHSGKETVKQPDRISTHVDDDELDNSTCNSENRADTNESSESRVDPVTEPNREDTRDMQRFAKAAWPMPAKRSQIPPVKRQRLEGSAQYLSLIDIDVPVIPMTGLELPYGYIAFAIYTTTSGVFRLRLAPMHNLGEDMRRYVFYQHGTVQYTGYLYRSFHGIEVFDNDCNRREQFPLIFCTIFAAFWNEIEGIPRRVPRQASCPLDTHIEPDSVTLSGEQRHPRTVEEARVCKNTYEEIGLDFPIEKYVRETQLTQSTSTNHREDSCSPTDEENSEVAEQCYCDLRDRSFSDDSLKSHASRDKRKKSDP